MDDPQDTDMGSADGAASPDETAPPRPPPPPDDAGTRADAAAPPSADAETGEGRRLRRSRDDRVVGGVCGGLGRYLGVDPVLVRLAFAALTLAGGSGVLIYIIAWIVIPEARPGEVTEAEPRTTSGAVRIVAGAVLVGVGSTLLLERLVPSIGRYVWPMVLIALGLLILGAGLRR